jgi:hypothetical protein
LKQKTLDHLTIWRESVCAGDDCDAPHEVVLQIRGDTLRGVIDRLLGANYLASISGGRATWILQTDSRGGHSLAVLAQQWSQPRFLVEPEAEASSYVQPSGRPHLYLRYWCQVDPERVFECLKNDQPLPDRYGR